VVKFIQAAAAADRFVARNAVERPRLTIVVSRP